MIDCTGLTEALFESELFGYERLSCQGIQVKLAFANAVRELNALNCCGGGRAALQAKHGAQPRLHVAMVLLNQVVQVF